MISLECGIEKLTQMNLKEKQSHRHRKQTWLPKWGEIKSSGLTDTHN